MKPKNYPAYRIAEYLDMYLKYLSDNNLGDDSKDITVKNLIGFVEEIILPENENS